MIYSEFTSYFNELVGDEEKAYTKVNKIPFSIRF